EQRLLADSVHKDQREMVRERGDLEPLAEARTYPPERALAAGPRERHGRARPPDNIAMFHRANAHATISGNSSRQNASPCDPTRSVITTSAPASRSASAHLVAFSRKNGSSVPATRYARGSEPGITPGGR